MMRSAARPMRILFLSTNLPVPANNGQAIRTLSIIQTLASFGHELRFLSFSGKNRPETLEPLSSYCSEIDLVERELLSLSQQSNYWRRGRALLRSKCYSIERFRSETMQKRIERHLSETSFDLIICDSVYALLNVPSTHLPIVLNSHNVEHVILQRYSQVENNLLRKYYALLEARLLRRSEQRACERANVAMVCSILHRDLLQPLCPTLPMFVIPNAIDTKSYLSNTDSARADI